jgi:hypothetical protein
MAGYFLTPSVLTERASRREAIAGVLSGALRHGITLAFDFQYLVLCITKCNSMLTENLDAVMLCSCLDRRSHSDMKQRVADLGNTKSPAGTAWQCGLAALAVLFGVVGLFEGSWPSHILGQQFVLQAMFGVLLCVLVAVRFHRHWNWVSPAPHFDIRELSRELSRMVYLSLYVVIGLRQIVGFADCSWHGGSVECGTVADGGLQAVVAYGIAGLLFIRVLAFGTWLHSARVAAG